MPTEPPGSPKLSIAQALETAVASHGRGDLAQAEPLYQAVLAANPAHGVALQLLGVLRAQQGRHDEGIGLIRAAIDGNPGYAEAHMNLGIVLGQLGRYDEARASLNAALGIDPGLANAHFHLGNALLALGRHAEALDSYRKALALAPQFADAHNNAGAALIALGRNAEAIDSFRLAIAINPAHLDAHSNLGSALNDANRPDEAMAMCRKALAIDARCAEAHANLGVALGSLGRYAEATASLQRALEINPGYPEAHWNLGVVLLTLGDYARGWQEWEWRWRSRSLPLKPEPPRPRWHGSEDLAGKTLLLHAEQGFGDTLQFARFAPLAARGGARVVLQAQAALKPLLAGLPGVSAVIADDEPLPACDFQCPLLSLPLALGTTLDNLPAVAPYLAADAEALARWRQRLGEPRGLRVGLVWSGRRDHKINPVRSIAPERLLPLLSVEGMTFVSLQKDVSAGDVELLRAHPEILDLGSSLRDFSDTAALLALLDLVISVDTSVAHLAGALGRPLWLLLAYAADWRWLTGREDCPWYPTARLYRQPQPGDWDRAVERVRQALVARAAAGA